MKAIAGVRLIIAGFDIAAMTNPRKTLVERLTRCRVVFAVFGCRIEGSGLVGVTAALIFGLAVILAVRYRVL